MTQDEALETLITFAPDWNHSIERRLAYTEGSREAQQWCIFIKHSDMDAYEMYRSATLSLALSYAIAFINKHRIEQALTCP